MKKILFHSNQVTPRLRYICRFLLGDILGLEIVFTQDSSAPAERAMPCIHYGSVREGDAFFIPARNLLFENGVRDQDPDVATIDGQIYLFPCSNKADLPADILAGAFFLVSRYEEYLPAIYDRHARFEASQSFAFKKNILQLPLVDQWAYRLRDALKNRYPELVFKSRRYHYLSSIDIDNAWAYKHKGLLRTVAGGIHALMKLRTHDLKRRIRVISGVESDPYDTYDYQQTIHERYQVETIYFFLFGGYGRFDKNVPTYHPRFQQLIKRLADHSRVGVHPSYRSNSDQRILESEIRNLSKVLHREIDSARQHFLKLRFPITYRNFIELGINQDYTMGYASQTGFRAGTCTPFNFYDLDNEIETGLTIYPFMVMDATLNLYLNLSPEQALQKIRQLVTEVRNVDGLFISLWHNESMGNFWPWKGWQNLYEEMVMVATGKEESLLQRVS